MRHQSREYLQKFLETHGPFEKVLEVGSLDVNGNIKDLFKSGYWGVDMRDGGNVNQVLNGHDLVKEFGVEKFDLVICFDTFEHDDMFWETLDNMRGVLKPNGWMMIGVPSVHCPEHDHPHDYWRFMPQSMIEFFRDFKDVETKIDCDSTTEADEIYGWGQK